MRKILVIAIAIVAAAGGAVALVGVPWFGSAPDRRPPLAEVPPLPPMTRTSVIVAPAEISLAAIRDALDASAPRNLTGRRDTPVSQLLSSADVGWTITRGPLIVAGRPDALAVTAPLNGTLRFTGKIADQVGGLGGTIGNLLGDAIGREVGKLAGKTFDQRADVRGSVIMTVRPAITAAWRLEPNLAAQVSIADAALSIVGVRLNVANEVKPFVERSVAEQVNLLQARLRNDPTLELAARRQWAQMCRAIPLGAAGAGLPNLWLEVRPTRAFAAQPRIDANAVTLTIGVQAETRIVPTETKPDCPFPAQLELVQQMEQGRVNIAVPIDVPFTEVNRILDAQLKGRKFPEDGSGPVAVMVKRATIAASGDRLLISLLVQANEKKSFFGFAAEATIHIWGRPALDQQRQILRLTDLELAVESEAAFGLLGVAARAAMPQLQAALAENAVVDLTPFAAEARKHIEVAVAEFRQREAGWSVDAAVTDLRLLGIAFDARTLRVIAQADGTAKVTVTALPAQ